MDLEKELEKFRATMGALGGFVETTGPNTLPIYECGGWKFSLSTRGEVYCDFVLDGFAMKGKGPTPITAYFEVSRKIHEKTDEIQQADESMGSLFMRKLNNDILGARKAFRESSQRLERLSPEALKLVAK